MKTVCIFKDDMSIMGGREKVVSILSNIFPKRYNTHLVTVFSKNNRSYYPINPAVKQHILFHKNLRWRYIYVPGIIKLRHYLIKNKIDVVLSIGVDTNLMLLAATAFTKIKTVFCEHGNINNMFLGEGEIKVRGLSAQKFDKVITLTNEDMQDQSQRFQMKNQPDFIPNCIDPQLENLPYQYDTSSKCILTCGRIDKVKGYDMLLTVAKKVFEKHPHWQWHIYGGGEELDAYRQQVKQAGLSEHVILKGQTQDMYSCYKNYAMYVLTSYNEGFPMVLLEAKANHLPVVSFNCKTGPKEMVRDGTDGFLVESQNTEQMAEKICQLIENESLRKEFSLNSTENLTQFTMSAIEKKWFEILDSL